MVVLLLFWTNQITAAAIACENKAGIDDFLKIARKMAYVVLVVVKYLSFIVKEEAEQIKPYNSNQ